jgi:hypothetical protein
MIENRHNKRLTMKLSARLLPPRGDPNYGKIRNMSLDGLFFETPLKFPVNNTVKVQFTLPGKQTKSSKSTLTAVVVHNTDKGVGLKLLTPIPNILMTL